jgi:hypothetical protein
LSLIPGNTLKLGRVSISIEVQLLLISEEWISLGCSIFPLFLEAAVIFNNGLIVHDLFLEINLDVFVPLHLTL